MCTSSMSASALTIANSKRTRGACPAQRIQQLPGIGPITASAIVASVGDAQEFRNGRQFAAWLGLVPDSTPRAARPASGTSRAVAIRTCALC